MTTIADRTTDGIIPLDVKSKSWTLMVDTDLHHRMGIGFHEDGVTISFYEVFGATYPVVMKRTAMTYKEFEEFMTPSLSVITPDN